MNFMLRRIKNRVTRWILGKRKSHYLNYTIHHHENDSLIGEIRKSGGGVYEEHETPIMIKVLQELQHPVMLDAGANIGLMTLNACASVANVRIYAIEPGPSQFRLLAQNIESNKLSDKVSVYNIALSSTNGEVDFYVHHGEHSSGDGMIDTGRAGDATQIKVKSCTLDTWWLDQAKPQIGLVKIDTEGSELQILENARMFIQSCRPYILIEMCDLNFIKYGLTYEDHLKFFESIRYRVMDTQRKVQVVTAADIQKNQYYYLAIPDEHKHDRIF